MRMLTTITACVLGMPALAGEGGVAPGNGTYEFKRTDPAPEQTVGTGKFEDGKTMVSNPGTSSEVEWDRNSTTGVYDHPGGHLSVCVHNGTGDPEYVYEYKLDGLYVSGGDLLD